MSFSPVHTSTIATSPHDCCTAGGDHTVVVWVDVGTSPTTAMQLQSENFTLFVLPEYRIQVDGLLIQLGEYVVQLCEYLNHRIDASEPEFVERILSARYFIHLA